MFSQTCNEANHLPQDFLFPPDAVSLSAWQHLLERLDGLTPRARKVDQRVAQSLGRLSGRLKRPKAMISFGGRFSAGKSSLLNCALGRSLLPVDDLPETGAACVLRAGRSDQVTVVDTQGRRRGIPCTTEAIRAEVALLTPEGPANPAVAQVSRLEIRLAGFPTSRHTVWIDAPGIDSGDESDRALRAAHSADILVWVLKSDQLLSETDIAALSEQIRKYGPGSVSLLINVFLARDTADAWLLFQSDRLPAHMKRIYDHFEQMGISDGFEVPVVVVSARAAAGVRNQYGGQDFRRLLAALDAVEAPLVLRSRLGSAAVKLKRLAARLGRRLKKLKAENGERQRQIERRRAEEEQRRKDFIRIVAEAVDVFMAAFIESAVFSANRIANGITAESLMRDGTYSYELTAALRLTAWSAFDALKERLDKSADRLNHHRLTTYQTARLCEMLTPDSAGITVPQTPVDHSGLTAGVIVGGLIGLIAGPAGIAIGAQIGRAVRGRSAMRESLRKDVQGAQENTRASGRSVANSLKSRRDQVVADILEFSQPAPAGEEIPRPRLARERRMRRLRGALSTLSRESAQLAGMGRVP